MQVGEQTATTEDLVADGWIQDGAKWYSSPQAAVEAGLVRFGEALVSPTLLRRAGYGLGPGDKWEAIAESSSASDSSRLFGKFELLEKLGQGGIAMVYRVREHATGRELALKALPLILAVRNHQLALQRLLSNAGRRRRRPSAR